MKTTTKLFAAGAILTLAAACAADPSLPPPTNAGYGQYGNDGYGDNRYPAERYPAQPAPTRNDPYYDRRQGATDPYYDQNRYAERYWDERAQRHFYVDERSGSTYWHNGELRSR